MDTVLETPAPATTEAFAVWQLAEGMPSDGTALDAQWATLECADFAITGFLLSIPTFATTWRCSTGSHSRRAAGRSRPMPRDQPAALP